LILAEEKRAGFPAEREFGPISPQNHGPRIQEEAMQKRRKGGETTIGVWEAQPREVRGGGLNIGARTLPRF